MSDWSETPPKEILKKTILNFGAQINVNKSDRTSKSKEKQKFENENSEISMCFYDHGVDF